MKRFLLAAMMVSGIGGLAACNKPEADDCRAALSNMQELLGTKNTTSNLDIESEVRRCRGGSSREAVQCALTARSVAALKACDFMGAKPKE